MSLSLTADEQQLIIDLENTEQGIADYGVRMFSGSLILHLDQIYSWKPLLKLWKPLSSKGEAQQIFVKKFLEEGKNLQKKLAAAKLQVQAALSEAKDDEKVGGLAQEIKTYLKRLTSALGTICQIAKQNAIWKKIENLLTSVQVMNSYNDVLPLRGGNKICLRTGAITERTREDMWSFEIQADGVTASEVEHEANQWFYSNYARDEQGVIDEEMLPFLQEVCAYATVFETCGKCFFVIKGVSDTGKSFYFERLSKLLKERVGGCSPEVFTDTGREEGHKTYYQDLEGKSAVCISELKENAPINGAQMKRLTGGDIIPYRVCYGTHMRYLVMTAVIFILTNFTQSFNGGDTGMVTRFVQIPFRYKHPKGHKLEYQERMRLLNTPGGYNATLAWIVEGTKKLFAKIDKGEEILVQPKIVKDASDVSVKENDHFLHFLAECCDVWDEKTANDTERKSYTFPRRPLQNAYTNFMRQHPEYAKNKLNPSEFKMRVQSEYSNGKADGDWVGIRPKTMEIPSGN